jgi:hypothetical protein
MSGSNGINRRNLLIGGLGLTAAALSIDLVRGPAGGAWANPAPAADPAEFAAARERWRRFYIPADLDRDDPLIAALLQQLATTARAHLANIDRAEPRLGVFTDSPFTSRETYADSQRVSYSTRRLREMALAWAAGALGSDADAVLTAIQEGLNYLTSDVWSTNGTRFGDWYDWDIAIPRTIHDAVVFTYDALTPGTAAAVVAGSTHFTPSIPRPGAAPPPAGARPAGGGGRGGRSMSGRCGLLVLSALRVALRGVEEVVLPRLRPGVDGLSRHAQLVRERLRVRAFVHRLVDGDLAFDVRALCAADHDLCVVKQDALYRTAHLWSLSCHVGFPQSVSVSGASSCTGRVRVGHAGRNLDAN